MEFLLQHAVPIAFVMALVVAILGMLVVRKFLFGSPAFRTSFAPPSVTMPATEVQRWRILVGMLQAQGFEVSRSRETESLLVAILEGHDDVVVVTLSDQGLEVIQGASADKDAYRLVAQAVARLHIGDTD